MTLDIKGHREQIITTQDMNDIVNDDIYTCKSITGDCDCNQSYNLTPDCTIQGHATTHLTAQETV
jgi:hypothetical protein